MLNFNIEILPNSSTGNDLEIWVPAIVAIISLVVNIFFSVFIAPYVLTKNNYKSKLYDICSEFLEYLSNIDWQDDCTEVSKRVREFSLKIHLMFKGGEAPKGIKNSLERLYKNVKERQENPTAHEEETWNCIIRKEVKAFRRVISRYIGKF